MMADSWEVMGLLNSVRYNIVTHTAFHNRITQITETLWNEANHTGMLHNSLKMAEWMSAQ
jgi:hypothetical protein